MGPAGKVVVFGKLPANVTFTESGEKYVPCKRETVWERIRKGGALSDVCHCPFCQGFPTVF